MMELRVVDLCKSYDGHPVLRNVTFETGPGITCLMGPSGTGKTTLLRILLGLESADSGEVIVPARTRFSVVFQEDRLLESRTAAENLRFVLGHADGETDSLLTALGLTELGVKQVHTFSGGMKRRLALARALAASFDMLLLDEPFTGLDEGNRQRATACIKRYAAGKPVLLVTHDCGDVEALDASVVSI